jgi:hypothetical protein
LAASFISSSSSHVGPLLARFEIRSHVGARAGRAQSADQNRTGNARKLEARPCPNLNLVCLSSDSHHGSVNIARRQGLTPGPETFHPFSAIQHPALELLFPLWSGVVLALGKSWPEETAARGSEVSGTPSRKERQHRVAHCASMASVEIGCDIVRRTTGEDRRFRRI